MSRRGEEACECGHGKERVMPRRPRRSLRRLYCISRLPPDHWITIGRCWRCGSPTAPP